MFQSKSNLDLIRALVVLKMCAIKPLVQHNQVSDRCSLLFCSFASWIPLMNEAI